MTRGIAVVILLVFPALVSANGFGFRRPTTTTASYYQAPAWPTYSVIYERPMYVAPAQICIEQPAASQPQQQGRLYAQPAPAGPSGAPGRTPIVPKTTEPPLSPTSPAGPSTKPGVTESRSFFNAYTVAPRANDKPLANRVHVGFWNLTENDVTLTISDAAAPMATQVSTHVVPKGKDLRIDLPRKFVWRIDAREAVNEHVPATESGLEIVIRR